MKIISLFIVVVFSTGLRVQTEVWDKAEEAYNRAAFWVCFSGSYLCENVYQVPHMTFVSLELNNKSGLVEGNNTNVSTADEGKTQADNPPPHTTQGFHG
jgi:hypothetical protein